MQNKYNEDDETEKQAPAQPDFAELQVAKMFVERKNSSRTR